MVGAPLLFFETSVLHRGDGSAMRKLLLQLDSSRLPSVFDQVVAYDAGADDIMSYGGITEGDVRDLIHGCIFTRGPKDLKNTAVWIGGNNMSAGEQLLAMAQDALFAPFSVSIMLDSNGSNTTAVAAVVKIEETVGDLRGKKVVILAGTGPVGQRAAGCWPRTARTSRSPRGSPSRATRRASSSAPDSTSRSRRSRWPTPPGCPGCWTARRSCSTPAPPECRWCPRSAWTAVKTLKMAVDLNAVPPLGIEGVEVDDAGERARGRRGLWRVRRRQLQDQAAQGVRHASCSRGTTWCSTPRRSPTWRGEW